MTRKTAAVTVEDPDVDVPDPPAPDDEPDDDDVPDDDEVPDVVDDVCDVCGRKGRAPGHH